MEFHDAECLVEYSRCMPLLPMSAVVFKPMQLGGVLVRGSAKL